MFSTQMLARLDRGDVAVEALPRRFDIEAGLDAEPELGCGAEVAGEPQGRVGRDGSFLAYQALHAGARHAQRCRECVGLMSSGARNSSRRISPGWTGAKALLLIGSGSSVIVDDLSGLGGLAGPR
jgi:hypothetical protein